MPSYTTDNELVPQVQRLAHIPLANVTFQPADICAFGDAECRTALLSQILSVRESYYLTYSDIAANASGVYAIPYRAVGGRVHDLQMVIGNSVYQLARIEPKDQSDTLNPPTNTYAFYFRGNNIVTLPILPDGVLRVWYYVRPSNLVAQATCAQVTDFDLVANTVTVAAVPSGYSTGVVIDFTQDQPPFGLLSFDVALTNVVGSIFSVGSGLVPSTIAIGDWICLAGTTPVPQLPLEFYPLLAQRVSVKILESQGYLTKMAAAQKKLMEMEKDVMSIINPRDEGNPKKITPSRSLVSPGPGRRGGFWYVAP
jgi:hypothetical protein